MLSTAISYLCNEKQADKNFNNEIFAEVKTSLIFSHITQVFYPKFRNNSNFYFIHIYNKPTPPCKAVISKGHQENTEAVQPKGFTQQN